jgi:hypothetical protein
VNAGPETSRLTTRNRGPTISVMSQCRMALGLILCVGGCSSLEGPHVEYDAPRVIGRVLDAETGRPVHRAGVQRWVQPKPQTSAQPGKGATRLRSRPVSYTDQEGRFVVPAIKSAYFLFGHGGVAFDATLAIGHPDYLNLVTNLTGAKLPKGKEKGPPEIEAGEIRLEPKRR